MPNPQALKDQLFYIKLEGMRDASASMLGKKVQRRAYNCNAQQAAYDSGWAIIEN